MTSVPRRGADTRGDPPRTLDWEKAILTGYTAWRTLRDTNGGVIDLDMSDPVSDGLAPAGRLSRRILACCRPRWRVVGQEPRRRLDAARTGYPPIADHGYHPQAACAPALCSDAWRCEVPARELRAEDAGHLRGLHPVAAAVALGARVWTSSPTALRRWRQPGHGRRASRPNGYAKAAGSS